MNHLFLFDVDGVLVDARGYLLALQDTVTHFSRRMGLGDLSPTEEEVRAFEANGLSSEWDSGAVCVAALLLARLRREAAEGELLCSLPAKWEEALSALGSRPFSMPKPDYAALAARVGQRAKGEKSPARAALAVLQDVVETSPALQQIRPILTVLLDVLLGRVNDYHQAPLTRHFQHLAIGSQAIFQTYGVPPEFECAPYLARYDHSLLAQRTRDLLLQRTGTFANIRAVLYTARPSLPPAGVPTEGYSPEAEMARSMVGLDNLPLIGRGRMRWLAQQAEEELEGMLKPSPVQALGAIGSAWAGREVEALQAAMVLFRDGRLCAPLDSIGPATIHVFEDSVGGLVAVEKGTDLLRSAGVAVVCRSYGVVSPFARGASSKAAALTSWGAPVYPSVNEAVMDALASAGDVG